MLVPIMGARQHGAPFVPDDLLRIQKTDPQQAVQNLAREDTRMPDVRDLKTWHELEGLRPISSRVPRNSRFNMTFRSLFHVARLGRPAAIQSGAITPFRVQFYAVGRVSHHQRWLPPVEQQRNRIRAGGIATQYSVLQPQAPQVSQLRYGHFR